MRYTRAAFVTGFVAGFLAGSRAGRERYDQIMHYSKKVVRDPRVQRAARVTAGKATDFAKMASEQAPKLAGSVTRTAKTQVARMPTPKIGSLGGNRHASGSPSSVNGDRAGAAGSGGSAN
jgi:hypothetical protein